MCCGWTFRSVFVFLAPLVLLQMVGVARAGEGTPQEQRDAGSPVGVYSLRIVPEDDYLRSGAWYTLSSHGKQVWSGRKPYTLQDFTVTDRGWVVGAAYSTPARRPPGGGQRKQYLNVVILDPTGREILNDMIERLPGPTNARGIARRVPRVHQVLADPTNDRIIIRGQDDNTPGDYQHDFWWFYRLSTGERMKRFRPTTGRSRMLDPVTHMLDMAVVVNTPLVLVHWYLSGEGARFTLVWPDGREIWSLDLEGDYAAFDDTTKNDLRNYVAQHPGILEAHKPGHFTIRSFAANERITFAATQAGDDDWSVKEVSRVEYVAPAQTGVPSARE